MALFSLRVERESIVFSPWVILYIVNLQLSCLAFLVIVAMSFANIVFLHELVSELMQKVCEEPWF